MSICASESSRKTSLAVTILALLLFAVLFHFFQSQKRLVGGDIAPAKLLWLCTAVLFFLLIPALMLKDPRLSRNYRQIYLFILVSMLLRAPLELYMMYITKNWHPFYGIAHNLFNFSVFVIALGLNPPTCTSQKNYYVNLLFIAFLLLVESYFAWYFAANFFTNLNDQGTPIYFVPDTAQYTFILNMTWSVDFLCVLYLIFFIPKWIRDV